MDFLTELKRVQGDRTLYRFSKDLEITYSTLWRFYHGKSGLSRRTATKICGKYSELLWAAGLYFTGKGQAA